MDTLKQIQYALPYSYDCLIFYLPCQMLRVYSVRYSTLEHCIAFVFLWEMLLLYVTCHLHVNTWPYQLEVLWKVRSHDIVKYTDSAVYWKVNMPEMTWITSLWRWWQIPCCCWNTMEMASFKNKSFFTQSLMYCSCFTDIYLSVYK